MDAWDIFCLTGHIDDYLHYRRIEGTAQQKTEAEKEKDQSHGNVSRSGTGTAQRWRQGEIH